MNLSEENVVIVTDIGCSGSLDTDDGTYGSHGLQGRPFTSATGVNLAGPFPGEPPVKCATLAMEISGACGYSTKYPVARFHRDAPTDTTVEWSSHICNWIIALDPLGIRQADR